VPRRSVAAGRYYVNPVDREVRLTTNTTSADPAQQAVCDLATGCLRTSPDAAEELLRRGSAVLERFIRVRLLSRKLPLRLLEDCGQNVLTRVWQFRASYRGSSQAEFWRWLQQICDNERRRILEREARRTMAPLSEEDNAEPVQHATSTLDAAAALTEELAALKDCLAHLDEKYRRVIELTYFPPALPERAIAQMLECSPANVHKLKDQGLGLLLACLGRKGIR